jgi:hypothetical protein
VRKRKRPDWVRIDCSACSGHGIYAGSNFYATGNPDECSTCDGHGFRWLSSNDRFAEYPGGKFLGSSPGAYVKELSKFHYLEVPSPRGRGGLRGNPGTGKEVSERVHCLTPL